MLKKLKSIRIICIVLVFSVLALAIAVGIVGINALRKVEEIDPLEGYRDPIKMTPLPGGDSQEILLPYRVRSDLSVDSVYLRMQSYGDYDGKTWLEPTAYTELIDHKYPATYLGTKQIEKWNLAMPIALEIEPAETPRVIPHYMATALLGNTYIEEYDIPIDDVSPNKKSDEYYRMYYYNYTDTSLEPMVSILEYEDYEARYRDFVYSEYLTVDAKTKSFMLNIAEEQGFDKNDYELASKISEYVMGIGEYSMSYDTKLDQEENVIMAFIEEYQEGTCKHFASVATLMFRSLGVPARYTVGYMTETVAGEWVQLTNFDAHAWVEIYVDGFGWKNVEVTPPRLDTNITIKPVDVEKLYDGTPLYPEQKVQGFDTYIEKGYTYEAVVTGERTEPGLSESVIETFKIFDDTGKEVTSRFSITYATGKIHIYTSVITLQSSDFTYIYDGKSPTSLVAECQAVFDEGESLLAGHKMAILPKDLPSAIGTHPHAFTVKIINEMEEDVTTWYKLKYDFGSVTVTANTLVLIAGSAEKIADGTPLICEDLTYEGILADGDVISSYKIIGSQTDPGVSANVVDLSSVVILNADGEDVTKNYILNSRDGILVVYEN